MVSSSRRQIVKLLFAPEACSLRRDGTLLITLSDALVAVGSDRQIQTLLAPTDWGHFYPNSSVLSLDEKKLYMGMRQYVGEFDLETKQLRYLIPNENFLQELSEEEDRIRDRYNNKRAVRLLEKYRANLSPLLFS